MSVLTDLAAGFAIALTPQAIGICFGGVMLGTFVGVLPGIGALAAISLCLPLTYYMLPVHGLILLAGIFYGAQYGASTSSILLNIPGTAAAAATCLDGHPMAKKGRAGQALFIVTLSSFFGGCVAIVLLIAFAPPLARFALSFGAPEYFAVMLLGLVAASTASSGSVTKGLAMVVLGLLLGMVGTDVTSGVYRFTLNFVELTDGINLVALAMGLFGIAEVLSNITQPEYVPPPKTSFRIRDMVPTRDEGRTAVLPAIRGSLVGSWVGALPGTGPAIAAFLAYALEKRISRRPEQFGTGIVEGIAAPEAANNASVQAAFIPTLCVGIPGDAVMAFMLGAMIIHGIVPGPQFIREQPDMFWGLVASFWVGNVILVLLTLPLISVWVRILSIPHRILYPTIVFLICVGVYSVNNNMFDVLVAIVFGVVGFIMITLNYPVAPILLGYILGPLVEENFRRTLFISNGHFSAFFSSPISIGALLLTVIALLLPTFLRLASHAMKGS
jgi:putative tricarboxylic transport membrane protein